MIMITKISNKIVLLNKISYWLPHGCNKLSTLTTKQRLVSNDEKTRQENETIDKKRSRLIYQSRKRGILETDLLLSTFASKYLKEMSIEELQEYDELLNELDWDIYYWATRNHRASKIPERWVNSKILQKLQDFAENKNKEILKMPDLDKYY